MASEGSALFTTRRDGLASERECDVIGCVLGNCCVITVPVSASWDFSVFVVVMFLSENYNVGVSVMCNSRVIRDT